MLFDKIKTLARLAVIVAIAFAVSQVPVVKREVNKFTSKINTANSVNAEKIEALETRVAELERRADSQDKLSFEQDARASVLTKRIQDLEAQKKRPYWRL